MLIADVLVTAPTATSEVWTLRSYAVGRKLDQLHQFRFGKLLFLAHDLCGDAFAIDRKWNEDRFPLIARDAFAAESNILDSEIDRAHCAL